MTEKQTNSARRYSVAHRGASAYAPEHTLQAYRLALEQGADFVEQDLQITRDGVLICLHDLTLERTTDVEKVFPNRYSQVRRFGRSVRQWRVSDFTLQEIKKLDAGSWFDAKFAGTRIPSWQEAIDLIRGKAGLYPETKGPEVYGSRGFDMERLVLDLLGKNKLDDPGADPRTPVIIQSFSVESLKKLALDLKVRLPLVLLLDARNRTPWLNSAGDLREVRKFAAGIGPAKELVRARPEIVRWARQSELSVIPYTFRSARVARGFGDVRQEMSYYLYQLGVDGLFTDNPDQFPRLRQN